MTIEEMKAQTAAPPPDIDFLNAGHWALMDLAPEILALVEAVAQESTDPRREWNLPISIDEALDAFNAKLEAL